MLLAQETESLCVPQYDLFLIFFLCVASAAGDSCQRLSEALDAR